VTGGELPTTIIGLAGLVILVVVPVAGGLMRLRLQQSVTSQQLREVHEQTVNDHQQKSNLRDDIDLIRDIVRDIQDRQIAQSRDITGMRADITGVRADITGVSQELHDERQRSIETDRQLWRAVLDRPDKPPSLPPAPRDDTGG